MELCDGQCFKVTLFKSSSRNRLDTFLFSVVHPVILSFPFNSASPAEGVGSESPGNDEPGDQYGPMKTSGNLFIVYSLIKVTFQSSLACPPLLGASS